MSVMLSDTRPLVSTTSRLIVLVVAIAVGLRGGLLWSLEISAWAYDGFVTLFAAPGFLITSMAMGIGVAYLVGFVHVTTICWLPAALAAMPMAQETRTSREWLKTV